ncbi:hypothetical protein GOP47_0011727 [Adiantum capillus-veneris]|uniref:Uncharacterized protein n=1 Tax=Adiantum capillus-veneris TaxID=13818 RepID=A0A9D4UTB1_ADICA|nr:hypothetical protein GOP47_0011727 [Adiantum capillus-veneris]
MRSTCAILRRERIYQGVTASETQEAALRKEGLDLQVLTFSLACRVCASFVQASQLILKQVPGRLVSTVVLSTHELS